MINRVFRGACAPLILSAAIVGAMWAFSYRAMLVAELSASVGQTRWGVCSCRGLLSISRTLESPVQREGTIFLSRQIAEPVWQRNFDELHWENSYAGLSAAETMSWIDTADLQTVARPTSKLVLPFWMMFALPMAPLARRGCIAIRARWRAAQGMCPHCAYDMVGMDHCPACAALTTAAQVAPDAERLAYAL